MFNFFASPETIQKLKTVPGSKLLLVGGFNGYWNFGDMMQLQGAIRWHRETCKPEMIIPFQHLKTVKTIEDRTRLQRVFDISDMIFYESESQNNAFQEAFALGLVPITFSNTLGSVICHVYGGGFFNHFWGTWMLELIESVLQIFFPSYYVISGQQVSPDFVEALSAHCKRYQPDLIGCRDSLSAETLHRYGLNAEVSGDDALEELFAISAGSPNQTSQEPAKTFGIHLNLSGYVYSAVSERREDQQELAVIRELDSCFQAILKHFTPATRPLVIGAYIDQRDHLDDSLTSIKKTLFTQYFPNLYFVDLVGLFIQRRLREAVATLRQCEYFVSTSYQVALLLKVLDVPTLLLAFNGYCQQKKRGIGESDQSFSEFLSKSRQVNLAEQQRHINQQRTIRAQWTAELIATLNSPPHELHSSFVAKRNPEKGAKL